MTSLELLYQVIRKPVVTEKGADDQHRRNAYHFRVPLDANKVEIRQAIEKIFNVRVRSVNTLNVRGKLRRRGWVAGQRPGWKKAMVTLAEGQTIETL
jgi:large subunit ribosomal protein L23